MRIISKFRDYYDNAGFYVAEPDPRDAVWVRNTEEETVRRSPFKKVLPVGVHLTGYGRSGQLMWWEGRQSHYLTPAVLLCTDIAIPGFLVGLHSDMRFVTQKEVNAQPESQKFFEGKTYLNTYLRKQKEALARWTQPTETFMELGTPLVLVLQHGIHSWTLIKNPSLTRMGQHIMEASQLYQRLDQYFNSDAARQVDPVPERTNELIRDAHGFDDRSFKHRK